MSLAGKKYDAIGVTYSATRRTDPRIAAQIETALGSAHTIVNVGAGTGNYEPRDRNVVAVEPSLTMIGQRPVGTAPCVRGVAEALPFPDATFDAALAVLTVHHWRDLERGIAEVQRVARRQVVFTFEPSLSDEFWLVRDYFPEVRDLPQERRLPDCEAVRGMFGAGAGAGASLTRVLVPADCVDGFGGSYWNRPEVYLDPHVQDGMSMFALLDPTIRVRGTERLRADLASGRWDENYGRLRALTEIDLGYRLLVCE